MVYCVRRNIQLFLVLRKTDLKLSQGRLCVVLELASFRKQVSSWFGVCRSISTNHGMEATRIAAQVDDMAMKHPQLVPLVIVPQSECASCSYGSAFTNMQLARRHIKGLPMPTLDASGTWNSY